MPNPAEFLKEVESCITILEQRQHELHKYLAAIDGLINFLIKYQKFIFKRLQKYRKHLMTRKNENHIRRRFSIIIMRSVESIKEATTNENIKDISDIDKRFVNDLINKCKICLYNIGKETFALNLL